MNSNIDFLIVGTGLYGATFARILTNAGYKCLILDKRNHIGGNVYSEKINGYDKHVYGPHVFHTNDDKVIQFVNKYSEWNQYALNIIARDTDKIYHLPFNMNMFYDVFNTVSPIEAEYIINKEIKQYGIKNPTNLEEQAINMVGKTIYEKLIKNYTEKQWGCKCTELPSDIIKRLPLRFYFDNNYFNDKFQGIPTNGYEVFVKNIIENVPYLCDIEFKIEDYSYWSNHVKYNIIYCGAPDELLHYDIGELGWRSLRFEDIEFEYNGSNGQGTAIINDVTTNPITRTVEHMWFTPNVVHNGIKSIITKEYPDNWNRGKEKYYPINNEKNNQLYIKYVDYLYKICPKIKLGGRLGKYKYFDMDDTILEAMHDAISFIEIHSL